MKTQTPEKKRYKVILILLVGLAAYSSAIKDLNNLKGMVGSLYEFTNGWIDTGLITAKATHISAEEGSCADSVLLTQGSAPEFRWRGRVAPGLSVEIKGINGDISAEAASGAEVEVVANRKAARSDPIQISTSGYAEAKTVNGEILAKIGDANWPDSLEFKTVNGEIVLDLPATINTEIKADTFNGEISTDFPLSLLGKMSRKHLSGRIGNGGRELVLKTLNGSIKLRRAS